MPYVPHTEEDVKAMLETIGVARTNDLFDEIPAQLHFQGFKQIPAGMNEMMMLKEAAQLANNNQNGLCFIGAGAYDHHIPAAVWDIASRGEFLTAYTPYQAEASQGTLQLLYEFQTMIAELTGMDVANASLYDGATAAAEAILMAIRLNRHSKTNRVLIAGTLHPFYRETIETVARNQHIEIINLPFNQHEGTTTLAELEKYTGQDITALVIVQPNFFGCLEPVDELTNWGAANNTIVIACVNPISLGLLKPPGEWGLKGVDIVCGEGQPLGAPMASGGPYFGFFSTRLEHVRQMPGRLIGRTVDKENKTGFTLTLQAREQHIRRAKATSNICTNQGLLVTAATIHMSLIGPQGLQLIAEQCHKNTVSLVSKLTAIPGIRQVFTAPYFHEALLQFEQPIEPILNELKARGIDGGYPVQTHYPGLANSLLICATEMRTPQDIEFYANVLTDIMK
ncbi:glycine dehydrogenase subunit 1 [Legionella beliardensis]|uniref:Probable glycine dehydrogenase (decarboxylating) subunit 1 n=1 Tax=Legionella beliardensis TaxID=91822 RepID=A0A378HXV2_9GAMM|nr:aminomethyl-transferring glycine dehydrogenase subunit GcvPA [Legionella beliardensis]STX27642.1 glycine dehydrogenase subunit 1 [Legionella beliardensis]